jgi:hypothetical protein
MNFKEQIVYKLGRSSITAGLEIILLDDGKKRFNLSLLRKKRTVIEQVSNVSSDNDYLEITKAIGSGVSLNLSVSGQGIITKKIAIEGIKESDYMHKVLPNASEKDFYIQNIKVDNTHAFISLVRKELIDKILQELNELKFEIISCSFGPFCISSVLPIIYPELSVANLSISAGIYNVDIKDGKINSIQIAGEPYSKTTYKMGEDEMEGKYLVSYSSALAYFTHDNINHPVISYIETSSSNYVEKRIFSVLSKGILSVFLVILLVNYFLFTHFYSKQNVLQSMLDTRKNSIEKYDTLKTVLAEKEDFLKKSGFLGEPKTSFYADQLAKDIPSAITLNEMNINPLKKSKDPEKDGVSFSSGMIDLLGACKDIIEFNNWVKLLKQLNWVKELKVLNYNYDREGNESRFTIEIYIK